MLAGIEIPFFNKSLKSLGYLLIKSASKAAILGGRLNLARKIFAKGDTLSFGNLPLVRIGLPFGPIITPFLRRGRVVGIGFPFGPILYPFLRRGRGI